MKSLIILLACILGMCAISCSNSVTTVRAVDAITNVPLAVEADTAIYNTGDTVWVDLRGIGTPKVSNITSMPVSVAGIRLFVLEY